MAQECESALDVHLTFLNIASRFLFIYSNANKVRPKESTRLRMTHLCCFVVTGFYR